MKSETRYFKIGLFVLLVLLVLVVGLIAFSAEFWMRDMILMETYLNESVQGLSVGSAVLQRGVSIGRVKQITFVARYYSDVIKPGNPEYEKFSHYVLVLMEIDPRHFALFEENPEALKQHLRKQIKQGLRIKLSYQGITGLAFLELDFVDPDKPPLFPPWMPRNLYIPSTPSLITSFTSAVESAFNRFEKINIEAAVDQLTNTLNRVETAIDEARLSDLSENAEILMDDLRLTSDAFRQTLGRISDPNRKGGLGEAASRIAETTARIDRLIDAHEYDIEEIILNIKSLSQNLRDLSGSLKQDPAQLLLSSPPARSEVIE